MPCRFMKIHLLNLLDGSPHEVPLFKALPLDLGEYIRAKFMTFQISSSMIALVFRFFSSAVAKVFRELIVWNWRTGEVVGFFFFSQEASFNLLPRYSDAQPTTPVSVTPSQQSPVWNSSRGLGYLPCLIVGIPNCSSSTLCYQSITREVGESYNSPRLVPLFSPTPSLPTTIVRWRGVPNSW